MNIIIAGIYKQTENYRNALDALGASWECTLDPTNLEEYEGLLIPGGRDVDPYIYGEDNRGSINVDRDFDKRQISIIKRFVEMKKPILGICRGHQVLNVFFGGTLIQHLDTSKKHRKNEKGDAAHMTTAEKGSFLFNIYGERFAVNSAHHQAVDKLGNGLKIVQKSDDGVVEGFYHTSLPIYGVQWHPERMCFKNKRDDTVDGKDVIKFFLDKCKSV